MYREYARCTIRSIAGRSSARAVRNSTAPLSPALALVIAQYRFDVDDRGSVDGLEGSDAQSRSFDFEDRRPMYPDRIGPTWGAGCEHAAHRVASIAPGVDAQYIALGQMQPG